MEVTINGADLHAMKIATKCFEYCEVVFSARDSHDSFKCLSRLRARFRCLCTLCRVGQNACENFARSLSCEGDRENC